MPIILIDGISGMNSFWAGGKLMPNYRKPFDMIVKTNHEYQIKKATSLTRNDLFDIWRPLADALAARI